MFVAALIVVGGAALSVGDGHPTTTQQRAWLSDGSALSSRPASPRPTSKSRRRSSACAGAGCEWFLFGPRRRLRAQGQLRRAGRVGRAQGDARHVIDVSGCIDPENRVAEFAAAGADAISFPPEATKQPMAAAKSEITASATPASA